MSSEYGNHVTFVGVNRGESLPDARSFSDSLGLSPQVHLYLNPDDSFYKTNEGYAVPEILFITKRGKIAIHQRGPLSIPLLRERVGDMFR